MSGKQVESHEANVFLPGCLGPVRRDVVLLSDHEDFVADLRAQLELALKVPSVAAMHSYLDTECAKDNVRLAAERDRLRDALQQIVDAEWSSSETATDFAISQTRGMLISLIKGIAREALSVKP